MEILTIAKREDIAGLYWASKALGHVDDGRLHVTRLHIINHKMGSRVIATDGSRMHIYDTIERIEAGYWEVINRRKTYMRIHRDVEYDKSRYPNHDFVYPPDDAETVKLSESTRDDAFHAYAALLRHILPEEHLINYGYVRDAMTPYEEHTACFFEEDTATRLVLQSNRRIAIIMPLKN